MRAAWAVFRKELLEAVRDRRTLLLGLLLPVIGMPAVTLGLPYLALREEARLRNAPARVAIVGASELREFIPAATVQGWIEVVAVRDPRAALERGTLPGLLLTPPDRLALVLGKFATVFTLSTTSVVLVMGTVLLSLRLAPLSAAPTSLSGGAVASLVGVGLVFAAFLSALQLLLSLAARSVREAQQLFTPVYLLAVGSVLLTQI